MVQRSESSVGKYRLPKGAPCDSLDWQAASSFSQGGLCPVFWRSETVDGQDISWRLWHWGAGRPLPCQVRRGAIRSYQQNTRADGKVVLHLRPKTSKLMHFNNITNDPHLRKKEKRQPIRLLLIIYTCCYTPHAITHVKSTIRKHPHTHTTYALRTEHSRPKKICFPSFYHVIK